MPRSNFKYTGCNNEHNYVLIVCKSKYRRLTKVNKPMVHINYSIKKKKNPSWKFSRYRTAHDSEGFSLLFFYFVLASTLGPVSHPVWLAAHLKLQRSSCVSVCVCSWPVFIDRVTLGWHLLARKRTKTHIHTQNLYDKPNCDIIYLPSPLLHHMRRYWLPTCGHANYTTLHTIPTWCYTCDYSYRPPS